MEFDKLQSGHRSFVSNSIVLTPVHCPANPGDKEQGIWWDCLLAMLGLSCLDDLKHPNLASSSLGLIWVRTRCVIASPWSERGAPHKVTCNLWINSDCTRSEQSNSKKCLKIFCDTHFFWDTKFVTWTLVITILWTKIYGKNWSLNCLFFKNKFTRKNYNLRTNNHNNIFFTSKIILWQKILHTGDTKLHIQETQIFRSICLCFFL